MKKIIPNDKIYLRERKGEYYYMNANLELYRIFCEVVKYKNISKAAFWKYIHITVSCYTINTKIRENISGKLFFRNKNGVELTEEGKNLYEYIGQIVLRKWIMQKTSFFSIYKSRKSSCIRICGGKFLVNKYVMPSLDFIKDYPNIDIRISRATTQESLKIIKWRNRYCNVEFIRYSNRVYKYRFYLIKSTPRYCFIATNDYIKENKISKDSNFENCKIIIPKSTALKQHLKEYCSQNNIDIAPNCYEIER